MYCLSNFLYKIPLILVSKTGKIVKYCWCNASFLVENVKDENLSSLGWLGMVKYSFCKFYLSLYVRRIQAHVERLYFCIIENTRWKSFFQVLNG